MQERKAQREKPLPAATLALVAEQIAIALKAGIPLHDAMETLSDSYRGSAEADCFERLHKTTLETGSLAAAFQDAGVFPAYMAGMARIGESAGKLDDVMLELAAYYRWEAEARQAVRNAVTYPAVLILMLTAVIAVLLVSVLPVFERVFASLGVDLAAAGAMQVGVTIGKVALALMALVLVAVFVIALLMKTQFRQGVLSRLCRIFPPIRRAVMAMNESRLASVLSTMLVAGSPVESAMELAEDVISDPDYREKLARCTAEMKAIGSFADAVARAGLFSEMHTRLVRFGSAAGTLDGVMGRIAGDCRTEADTAISNIVALIEPTLVTVLSVVIGGILLSVMLPLLSILSAMG